MLAQETPSWSSLSSEGLDRFAWKVVCNWTAHANIDVTHNGLDYSQLTRHFLWDKVSRAIRSQVDRENFAFEAKLLNWDYSPLLPQFRLIDRIKQPLQSLSRFGSTTLLKTYAASQNTPVLYVPCVHPQLKTTIAKLAQSSTVTIVSPHAIPKASRIRRPHKELSPSDRAFAKTIHQGIVQGLHAQGIKLLDCDTDYLQHQILQQVWDVKKIEIEITTVNPDAILVFADNHHPVQAYVLAARKAGIPSIMLQHGLDCEHYCLDEAYASVIAVWGNARLQRYQKDSNWQPDRIEVTGHPEFDHLRLPEQLNLEGNYWLWVTRPHQPEKCYIPSRSPQEAIDILNALFVALWQFPSARLLIKPHPLENLEIYQEQISNSQLSDRVTLTQAPVQSLLTYASLVISEDSTAGLEAMFLGKVIVHVHFASSPPVMPYVQYGAALPAGSIAMLQASLSQAQQLTDLEQQQLIQGQQSFLKDFAGDCDGQASQRVTSLILSVLFHQHH